MSASIADGGTPSPLLNHRCRGSLRSCSNRDLLLWQVTLIPPRRRINLVVRKVLLAMAYFASVPIFFVALPVVLPLSMISDCLHFRKLARQLCDECGTAFGHAEIRRARDACTKRIRLAASKIMSPESRPLEAPVWDINCPHCRTSHTYTPNTEQFRRNTDAS